MLTLALPSLHSVLMHSGFVSHFGHRYVLHNRNRHQAQTVACMASAGAAGVRAVPNAGSAWCTHGMPL